MQYKLGFIGCGNMGGALLSAVAKKVDGKEIAVCDYSVEKVENAVKEFGVVPLSIEELAKNAEFIVLGVKPQAMESALAPITEILQKREDVVLITMAAGLSIEGLAKIVGKALPTVRIMPNTPAKVGAGMILYSTSGVPTDKTKAFLAYFEKAGAFDYIEEEAIDAGSALSGCGPAFVYAFAEALIKGAEACGVPADKALLYTAQTLKGASEMILAYGDPAPLRVAVCSPNGTTLAGIGHLEKEGFTDTVAGAVEASYKRTLELKK